MHICYIDESGDVGRFNSTYKDSQPAFILVGLILPQSNLRSYTSEFISLKQQHYPDKCKGTKHDAILAELKGSDLRQAYVKPNNKNKRHVSEFFNQLIKLISTHNGKIIGRAYIKEPDGESNPDGIYTYSMQSICQSFQHYLAEKESFGAIICDSRNHNQNAKTSHAIFTQMYKHKDDAYPNIIDMPTFGDSRNHAGIQTADLLSSALLFPMAIHAYCLDKGLKNTHIQPKYITIREKYWSQLAQLQYRYDIVHLDKSKQKTGGIIVSDKLGHKHGGFLFSNPKNDNKPSQTQLTKLVHKFNH